MITNRSAASMGIALLSISVFFVGFESIRAETKVEDLPKPTGYVSDLAHVVSPEDKSRLEAFCTKVEQQLGAQFALVTINTIGDEPIRDFALDLGRSWGVGPKKDNQGVLLLLVIQDRKSDIETGRGIEPYLTDGFSGSVLRAMRPDLRASDYGAALIEAARSMAAQIAQAKGIAFSTDLPAPEPKRVARRQNGFPGWLVFLAIFFFLWLIGRGGRRGGGGGGYYGGGRGFWTGLLLSSLLNSGRRDRDGWGGGGFGGGDSGGGGGFGGFGGGDFGGGGASSNW